MTDCNDYLHNTIIEMKNILKPGKPEKFVNSPTPKKRVLSGSSDSDSPKTPAKQFKDNLDATYVGSPREVRRIRADLIDSRNTITSLKAQIQHMHTVRKEMQLMFDNETRDLKVQSSRDKKNVEHLEIQLQDLRKRELEGKHSLSDLKAKHSAVQLNFDIELTDAKKKLALAMEEKLEQVTEKDIELSYFKTENVKYKDMYQAACDDAEAHKNLAVELEKQLAEKNAIDRDIQMKDQALQKAKMKIKDLQYDKDSWIEYKQQMDVNQQRIANYSELERENKRLKETTTKLKEEVRNKLILEEEVNDLRGRLINYREHEQKLTNLQVTLAHAQVDLEEWRSIGRQLSEEPVSDSALPRLMRSLVERLHQQEINLTSEQMQLKSEANSLKRDLETCHSELKKATDKTVEMREEIESRQKLTHRMQKKLILISGERDNYRALLDSHEKDLTITSIPSNSTLATQGTQHLRDRIEGLERMVESYREAVNKLEADLQQADPRSHTEIVPARLEQINRLQVAIERLRHENTLLRQRKDQLEIQLEENLVGQDFSLGKGKIYHLSQNPTSLRIAEERLDNEKLREEIIRLKQKLKKLEQGMETSTVGDSAVICPQQVAALKDQIANAEAREQRVKDCYRNSMREFRDTIYVLFGYSVDVDHQNERYKLRSEYVANEADLLVFQWKDGKMNLMENDFTATPSIRSLIESHLIPHNSFPIFLGALTINLFNEHTQTMQASAAISVR